MKIIFRFAILFVLAFWGALAQTAKAPADELFAQGYVLLEAGNAQAAKDKFERGLQTAPSNPLAHFFLGKAYFTLENYDSAKAHLERSLELDPTNQYASDAKTLLKKVADANARANRETAEWVEANGAHSAAPLELYLREFPNGAHAAEAKSQLAQVAEEQARQAELARQEYARQSEQAQQIHQRVEDDYWAAAQIEGAMRIEQFLEMFLNGRYADAAKELLIRPKIDPVTKLMWAGTDNANRNDGNGVNWSGANYYCSNLRLEEYTDWRLPSEEEFLTLDTKRGDHFSAKLSGSGPYWTSTKKGTGKALLYFRSGTKHWEKIEYSGNGFGGVGFGFHARCVRGPVQ